MLQVFSRQSLTTGYSKKREKEFTFVSECVQYRSNVSYHLSPRFSRDESRLSRDSSRFLRDDSRFSRYESRFSRESLRRSVWNILLVRSRFPRTVKGRYKSDGTDRQDDKKDTERQLLASLKYLRYIRFYLAQLDDSNAEIVQIYRKSVLSKFLRCAVNVHLIFDREKFARCKRWRDN